MDANVKKRSKKIEEMVDNVLIRKGGPPGRGRKSEVNPKEKTETDNEHCGAALDDQDVIEPGPAAEFMANHCDNPSNLVET